LPRRVSFHDAVYSLIYSRANSDVIRSRYFATIINGLNNPYRAAVAADIRNAVLKVSASKDVPAQYWTKEEQEAKVRQVYEKYSQMGGVWSAAAHTV
jgi:hypothetical protein